MQKCIRYLYVYLRENYLATFGICRPNNTYGHRIEHGRKFLLISLYTDCTLFLFCTVIYVVNRGRPHTMPIVDDCWGDPLPFLSYKVDEKNETAESNPFHSCTVRYIVLQIPTNNVLCNGICVYGLQKPYLNTISFRKVSFGPFIH